MHIIEKDEKHKINFYLKKLGEKKLNPKKVNNINQ